MHLAVQTHVQGNIVLEQALLEFVQLLLEVRHVSSFVVGGDEDNTADGCGLDHSFAKPDEVGDLVRKADVRVLDYDRLRSRQIGAEDSVVGVPCIPYAIE
jgi:hypothetical protein